MGDLINMNRARKDRAKASRAATADANRVRFGRSKARKSADAADAARRETALDGARRED